MKLRVLLASLVITLMMSVQGYANPCDCVSPCGGCDYVRSGDLFSGLKKLVNGAYFSSCDPCDAVVACNPCDDTACETPRFALGGRLRSLFASTCNDFACNPCDEVACDPCDVACTPCDTICGPKFTLPRLRLPRLNLFNNGCFTGCDPCGETQCNPCDEVACGPCDVACNPCDDICGDYCGPRGRLFDLPRLNLSRLFGGLCTTGCNDVCNPCDEVRPCDSCF